MFKFDKKKIKLKIKYFLKLLFLFLILFLIYVVFIQLWAATSKEYPPEGFLDHKTKTGPAEIRDWTRNRRMHD